MNTGSAPINPKSKDTDEWVPHPIDHPSDNESISGLSEILESSDTEIFEQKTTSKGKGKEKASASPGTSADKNPLTADPSTSKSRRTVPLPSKKRVTFQDPTITSTSHSTPSLPQQPTRPAPAESSPIHEDYMDPSGEPHSTAAKLDQLLDVTQKLILEMRTMSINSDDKFERISADIRTLSHEIKTNQSSPGVSVEVNTKIKGGRVAVSRFCFILC